MSYSTHVSSCNPYDIIYYLELIDHRIFFLNSYQFINCKNALDPRCRYTTYVAAIQRTIDINHIHAFCGSFIRYEYVFDEYCFTK